MTVIKTHYCKQITIGPWHADKTNEAVLEDSVGEQISEIGVVAHIDYPNNRWNASMYIYAMTTARTVTAELCPKKCGDK